MEMFLFLFFRKGEREREWEEIVKERPPYPIELYRGVDRECGAIDTTGRVWASPNTTPFHST